MWFLQNFAFLALFVTWSLNGVYTQPQDANDVIFDLERKWDENQLLHETAAYMLGNMKLTTDPCEDFYEYACGNWANNNRVPQWFSKQDIYDIISYKIHRKLEKEFLSEDKEPKTTILRSKTAFDKAKIFFKSCYNTGKITAFGNAIRNLFCEEKKRFKKLKLQGEPDDWLKVNFMSRYSVYPLLPLKVFDQGSESGKYEISLAWHSNLTEFVQYNRNEFPEVCDKCLEQFRKALAFESKLFTKYKVSEKDERVTLEEFLKLHANDPINWRDIFGQIFPTKLQEGSFINNCHASFNELVDFLRKTPINELRNYVRWCEVVKFYDIWRKIFVDHKLTRQDGCRELTENYFASALLPWYKNNLYDEDKHTDISNIAKTIKADFYNTISNNFSWLGDDFYSWLDAETISNIKAKLEDMKIIVGFEEKKLQKELFFEKVPITTDLFKNIQVLEAKIANKIKRLVNRRISDLTLKQLLDVDSHYYPLFNAVLIRIGLAQMPFYHVKFPPALKFGGIGVIIAHELAHAFDYKTYHYESLDTSKTYYKKLWLSQASLANIQNRTECLFNQYKEFTYHGLKADKASMMDESIADNAGLHMSYYSYLDWEDQHDPTLEVLPDTDFTNNQLFFIAYAHNFCFGREYDVDSVRIRNEESENFPPDELRVMVPLRNMDEFTKTFNCKKNSRMNPEKKCRVW